MTHKTMRAPRTVLAAVLALFVAVAVAACGGSEDAGSGSGASGNGTDVAFADEMIQHHSSAVDMAKIAQRRARTTYVKDLANDVVAAQTSEISTMRGIQKRLPGVDKADLGMSMSDMGMDMDASMLRDARPFDREFVDVMIPHHQGAIRMARIELQKGQNGKLRDIAEEVVSAQAREIRAMNKFRVARYGAPSPAGGVPAAGDSRRPLLTAGAPARGRRGVIQVPTVGRR
jgi:uncharacterized protein (DUF305 family)